MHTPSPVSIDVLGTLCGVPFIKVLNLMERLKKKKIVSERKGFQKGIYFFDSASISRFVEQHIPEKAEDTQEVLKKILRFYEQLPGDDSSKTLILAHLYRKCGEDGKGLHHIRAAAKILSDSGKHDDALTYYDYLLRQFTKDGIDGNNVSEFLESILGKISITGRLMSSGEQISLLDTARSTAKRFRKWSLLTDIELALGKVYQQEGDHKNAYRSMNAYRMLARKIGDEKMIKRSEILLVEFLHWEGKESEVIRRYESVIGDLEEFEDDPETLKATARVGLCYVLCGRLARGFGMIDAVRAKADKLGLQHVSIFCDLMEVLGLFEIRKVDEAVPYVDRILSFSDNLSGHSILRPIFACKAYLSCMNGDYEEAYRNVNKVVEHSRMAGWMYHKGPWNFEYLKILESNGFYHNEMNYDGEIERSINWTDVYMKGVAYRYRAQKSMERGQSLSGALADLKNSEKYLKQSGIEIELARTHAALGDIYLKRGDLKVGQSYLKTAWLVLSKIDKGLFPKDLLAIMPQEHLMEAMMDRIIGINESLSAAHDMSSFLERVVDLAMDFTMATRGAFVTAGAGNPTLLASRNLDSRMLKPEHLSFIEAIISSIAKKGIEVFMIPGETSGFSEDSLLQAGVTSLVCVPVELVKEKYGYLYLDNRLAGRPFQDNSVAYLRLLCNQIAIGISNIRLYEEMKVMKDRFENEATFYKRELGVTNTVKTIIGQSQSIKHVIDQISQVAPADSTVLILGETGVGKELVAKAIHNLSERRDGPFIPVNLAALPPELVVSELFGHEKGAFTGAHESHKGRFELAHGGTIFLDEIGDLPLAVQVALLRVLQEGKFERLGSTKAVSSNFRVIAATHKDLRRQVENGSFRQDLYYRLNVFPITVPPLRERKGDIPLLANHFLNGFCRKRGTPIQKISRAEMGKLEAYYWPGNVRELEHFIERSVILSGEGEIIFSGLENTICINEPRGDSAVESLEEIERKHIQRALEVTRGRVSGPRGAALMLGIKPTTLFFRMKKLGISKYSLAPQD